jgi:DNA-binding transcriptional MerR regulator
MLKHLDYWILVQAALELVLVVLVVVFLAKIKTLRRLMTAGAMPEQGPTSQPIRDEGEKRGGAGGLNLENMLSQLAQRSSVLQHQLDQLESRIGQNGSVSSVEESGASLRSRVEHLFRHGLSPEEIARRLGLNLAEVKVALDLARAGARS